MELRQILVITAVTIITTLVFLAVASLILFFLIARAVRVRAVQVRAGKGLLTPESTRTTLEQIRKVAWFMDDSIPIGGGYRIGFDGLIDVVPGIGDMVGVLVSGWIIYSAASLGVPTGALLRMAGNVAIDALLGSFPILGMIADSAFKANLKNVAILDKFMRQHYPALTEVQAVEQQNRIR